MSGVTRHPIRGFFAGLCAGLGVALLLILTSQIALGTNTPFVVVVVGVLVGVAWSLFGPPRRRRGALPTAAVPQPPAPAPAEPVEAASVVDEAGDHDTEVVEGWDPTHVAPADGLVTYAGADEGGGENGRLAPGLPVQIVERNDQWAHIVCSNGWAAWVDAKLLVEHPGAG